MVYGNNVYDLISTMYVDTFKPAKYQAFYYPKTEGWSKYIAIKILLKKMNSFPYLKKMNCAQIIHIMIMKVLQFLSLTDRTRELNYALIPYAFLFQYGWI